MLKLPWLNPILSPNKRLHWAEKNAAKNKAKNDAYILALSHKPPRADTYHLKIIFHPPDKRSRDLDNCLANIKGEVDSIAQAWGVNDKQFRPITIDFGEVVKGGEITVEVL